MENSMWSRNERKGIEESGIKKRYERKEEKKIESGMKRKRKKTEGKGKIGKKRKMWSRKKVEEQLRKGVEIIKGKENRERNKRKRKISIGRRKSRDH